MQLFRKNKADIDFGRLNYDFVKLHETIENSGFGEHILVTVNNPYGLKIRPEKQIAMVLGISRSQAKSLLEKGDIEIKTELPQLILCYNISRIDIRVDAEWTWNCFIDEMLNRAEERIKRKHYFDINKIYVIKKLQQEIQEYLDKVLPTPYLDDISTKNLLIYEGKLSGIIDIDWMGFGDMLTFVALTKVALLNMDLDTRYIDYLLDEIHPDTT